MASNTNAPATKKVVPANANAKPTGEKKKRTKKVRPSFQFPKECLDENGKITSVPSTLTAENISTFARLKKEAFADRAANLEYRAVVVEARAARMTKLASRLREDAKMERSGGGEMAKKLAKLQKMRDAAKALEAELAAEGFSI